MSDIFSGTQPPAWLQEIARPIDPHETGQAIGRMIGGMGNAYDSAKEKQDNGEQTTWLKELPQAMQEAKMNIADPMWRLKVQSAQLKIGEQKLQMDAQQEALTARKTQMAWMSEDMQNVGQWMRDNPTPEARAAATPPIARTPQYQKVVDGVLKSDINKDAQIEFREQINSLRKLDPVAASRYSGLIGKPIPKGASDQLGKDMEAAQLRAATKAPTDTAAVKNVNQISKWEADARAAEAAGDTETAKDLRGKATELREQLKGQSMTLGYDDQGMPIVSVGKGGTATVATQTMAQGKMLQYENATQLMNYLSTNLTESHIGLAGAAGELIVDRTLAQFVPGAADKERVKSRTTLIALREGLLREMSDDRTGRFTMADRDEIAKALPSSGVFESLGRAKESIGRVREILADRAKVYANAVGQPPPLWSLSKEEIVKRYQDGVKSKLDPRSPEWQKNFVTKDQASDALVRFH